MSAQVIQFQPPTSPQIEELPQSLEYKAWFAEFEKHQARYVEILTPDYEEKFQAIMADVRASMERYRFASPEAYDAFQAELYNTACRDVVKFASMLAEKRCPPPEAS